MKRTFLLVFTIVSINSFSQETNNSRFWDHVRFGGGFGMGFGNNSTNIAVFPSAIYDFNEYFAMGVNLGYQYAKRNDVKSNVFSTGILGLVNPIYEAQLSIEFEQLFVNSTFGDVKENYNYPALYFGGAYQVSNGFAIGLRYDVLYNSRKSIYASAFSPVLRIFF
jgi:long-subunit fatty acid transport protein